MKQRLLMASVLALAASSPFAPGYAQDKNPGPLIGSPPARPAAPVARPPASAGGGGSNPQVQQLSQSLPLDPATSALRDNRPGDVAGTERQLGLREPRGTRADMRGRTPSSREIVDALAPR